MLARRIALFGLASVFGVTSLIGFFASPTASAVTAAEWQAGRIIDDAIFTDKYGMSVAQIQDFLNQKVGTGGYASVPGQCDTNGARNAQPFSSSTRAEYARSLGRPDKFTCLSNYYEVPKTAPGPDVPASNYGGAPIPAGAKSAAQLIWDAAQQHNINPKVLLVTIQKESAGPLTTDDWPFQKQFTYAMGAHCPDSGPNGTANCDTNYSGFSLQISESAELFRWYLNNMDQPWWSYKKLGNNTILYQNAKPECGSSVVNITSRATAALYTYTPYQPNAAALNNMYGTGDSCSAYGNRNFWRIYNDWFGSTRTPEYRAQAVAQAPAPYLKQGESTGMYARFRNTGNQDWYDDTSAYSAGKNPVRIATDLPMNHASPFASGWMYPHRPGMNFARVYDENGAIKPGAHIARPGESVEFWFAYKAPHSLAPGTYSEGFRPIVEGLGPMNDTGTYFTVNVMPAVYTASYAGQSAFPNLKQGQKSSAFIRYKNTGNYPWYDDTNSGQLGQLSVHLGTDYPLNRNSEFSANWPYPHRAAVTFSAVYEADGVTLASNQHVVMPGQVAKFDFSLVAPANKSAGFYSEALRLIVQGKGPMNDTGTWMGVTVDQANYTATYAGQSAYPTIRKGQSGSAFMRYKNTGNVAWYDDSTSASSGILSVHLGTDYPLNRNSEFSANWPYPHRAAVTFSAVYEADGVTLASNQHVVQIGQIAQFNFPLTVPLSKPVGFYAEALRLVVQGKGPMNDTGTWMGVNATN